MKDTNIGQAELTKSSISRDSHDDFESIRYYEPKNAFHRWGLRILMGAALGGLGTGFIQDAFGRTGAVNAGMIAGILFVVGYFMLHEYLEKHLDGMRSNRP